MRKIGTVTNDKVTAELYAEEGWKCDDYETEKLLNEKFPITKHTSPAYGIFGYFHLVCAAKELQGKVDYEGGYKTSKPGVIY